jgi:hypothetical protein
MHTDVPKWFIDRVAESYYPKSEPHPDTLYVMTLVDLEPHLFYVSKDGWLFEAYHFTRVSDGVQDIMITRVRQPTREMLDYFRSESSILSSLSLG